MIYRRYEKQHPRKDYVQIVEIFGTANRPPQFIENERELNDFLGRDAFKTDMNCTVVDDSTTKKPIPTTTRASTTTQKPTTIFTIPTTAYRQLETTTTAPTITKPPNLNNLFTIKTTKPTIRPNPKENENPDYTELYNWPTPNVQVTKHLPSTIKPPLIVIQETDDQINSTEVNIPKPKEVETTTVSDNENYDEEQEDRDDYSENGNESDKEYDENSYDLLDENDLNVDTKNQLGDDENYDYDEEDEEAKRKRRKRLNRSRRRRKHIMG